MSFASLIPIRMKSNELRKVSTTYTHSLTHSPLKQRANIILMPFTENGREKNEEELLKEHKKSWNIQCYTYNLVIASLHIALDFVNIFVRLVEYVQYFWTPKKAERNKTTKPVEPSVILMQMTQVE